MREFREIRYEVVDAVATVTLHPPERLNAFTPVMAGEIGDAFAAADDDDEVRAVILTGAGRCFCAGADLGGGKDTFNASDERRRAQEAFGEVDGVPRDLGGVASMSIAASRKPVIAAVNRPAVGVGATMILPADVRLAAESARFGYVFARRGLVPESAAGRTWPRASPRSWRSARRCSRPGSPTTPTSSRRGPAARAAEGSRPCGSMGRRPTVGGEP